MLWLTFIAWIAVTFFLPFLIKVAPLAVGCVCLRVWVTSRGKYVLLRETAANWRLAIVYWMRAPLVVTTALFLIGTNVTAVNCLWCHTDSALRHRTFLGIPCSLYAYYLLWFEFCVSTVCLQKKKLFFKDLDFGIGAEWLYRCAEDPRSWLIVVRVIL